MTTKFRIEITEAFTLIGTAANGGGYIVTGTVHLNAPVTVTRDDQQHTGTVISLRRYGVPRDSINAGHYCGIGVSGWKFAPGDVVTEA